MLNDINLNNSRVVKPADENNMSFFFPTRKISVYQINLEIQSNAW